MNSTIRVGIVDDHPLMLEGIAQTVKAISGFEIVGLGSSLNDSLSIAHNRRPEVMLLDVSMPGGGIEAARRLSTDFPTIKLMMLTVSERYDHVTEALKLGVRGYLLKGANTAEFRDCLHAVVNGKRYITNELLMGMLVMHDRKVGRHETKPELTPLDGFTVREKAVVELLALGKPNKRIAEELGISEKTVKHYMTIIMQKLNVQNRVEAVLALTQKQAMLSELLDDPVPAPRHHSMSSNPLSAKTGSHSVTFK